MSSTADVADSATAVQVSLTAAEASLIGNFETLPTWYLTLRDDIHGLITDAAWAVGEDNGAAIMGARCQPGQPHEATCKAYRASPSSIRYDPVDLPLCPQCRRQVHSLAPGGDCHGCRTARYAT